PVKLEVYLSPKINRYVPSILKLEKAPLVEIEKDFDSQIIEIADKIDADIVVSDSSITDFDKQKEEDLRLFTSSIEEAKLQAEIFVRGHEIPWAFDEPLWHMPWGSFYTMCDYYGKEAWSSYSSMMGADVLKANTNEVLRSLLLNKFSYICHARDKLLFYMLQRSYAKRNGFKKQDYRFEAGFHLTYYYLLIWGGIDQLSIIINDLLELGSKGISVSIGKENFRKKIMSINEKMGEILIKEKYLVWFEHLRKIRNFVAHEGTIILQDLFDRPEVEPSEKEIEMEAKKHPSYLRTIKNLQSEQMRESYLGILKEDIRVSKLKKISDEAMIFKVNGKQYIIFPLKEVEPNFNTFRDLLTEMLPEIRTVTNTQGESQRL
ncbi:MAG: hypothetical protein QQN41_10765, partial [Nitrosopumilus sp.]